MLQRAAPGLEIRVFDRAIVYCVDRRMADGNHIFVRPADSRIFTDPDFQSGLQSPKCLLVSLPNHRFIAQGIGFRVRLASTGANL